MLDSALMINRFTLFMNFGEYFCPWFDRFNGSPPVFPCLSQTALHQFLPAPWSWRLSMSHLIQKETELVFVSKETPEQIRVHQGIKKKRLWCYTL